jgi:vacuolar protein sorting-associated protein 8
MLWSMMLQIQLGNKILVYISCCLAGRAYPRGNIPSERVADVKDKVLRCVTALHTSNSLDTEPAYPHLRTLLHFDTREFFNVLALGFEDTDLKLKKKQRIVDILLLLMVESVGFTPTQVQALCLNVIP